VIRHKPPKPITSFLLQKFCTKSCADKYGLRLKGAANPRYKGDAARNRSRSSDMARWALKVIRRDRYKCIKCGVDGEQATLQAHHVWPIEFYPDRRSDLENGITLCSRCHWDVHQTLDERYITLPASARKQRKKKPLLLEGTVYHAKVFGKDARKWKRHCFWYGSMIVKRLSDVTGKASVFCDTSCSSKHRRAFGKYRPTRSDLIPPTAVPPAGNISR
jgi:hypothetical protein